jgi:hypothetical protein
MRTYKRLVAAGCSFTYGLGLEDPVNQSWPGVLGKLLDCEVVNLGTPGAGNSYIANSILDQHATDPEFDLVVVGWSRWARMDFCHSTSGKILHMLPNGRATMTHPYCAKETNFRNMLYGDYFHAGYAYKKYLNTILLLQGWLRDRGIEHVMFDALERNHDGEYMANTVTRALSKQIDRSRFIRFATRSMDSMTDVKHKFPDGHPNSSAHARMAEIVQDFLLNIEKGI